MNRLYHVALSPFCRKVRLTLAEKKIEVELIEEKYWDPSPDFLRHNPAGKVPILRIDNRFMPESQAICEYIEEAYQGPALMPRDRDGRYEVRRLCAWFDDKFNSEVTEKIMGERVWKKVRKQGYPDSKRVKEGLRAIRYHLDYMGWLLEQRRWLAGDQMTLADFAAAAHLSCLDYISDVNWDQQSAVRDWYSKIKSRPAFRPLLQDQLPGMPPSPQYAELDF